MASVLSLVATDIVDSTRLWARSEREMSADLAVHDELVATVVRSFGGTIFKHTGDGAMAVFEDPVAAVATASEIQRALRSTPWQTPGGIRARAAVHSGRVIERAGDYFGTAVNRVARLLGACPPDAVLVSAAAAGLLADPPLDGVRLAEAGRIHLRGFAEPEVVYAVVADHVATVGVLGDDGPVGEAGRGSLPSIDDRLLGRDDELTAVWEALQDHHVVSIIGIGGMGKTRLALAAAAGAEHGFGDGAWWCDLAPATNPDAVVHVLLDSLGARQAPGRTAMESVTDALQGRVALVVLDNCEHVVDAARDIVRVLRATCPSVRLLVTSREALGVSGEHLVAVSSLSPADAAQLFVARAETARPGLRITDDELDVAGRICARLDGIPLAIELAAARCRSMTAEEIDRRLDDRYRLLRGGRSSVERHRTLQAAVAWSYDLLDHDEREVFELMAVFADGAHLDGIAAVCGLDEYDALDIVDRLVARSMVVPTSTQLGTRYRLLETLRQFAEDRLAERSVLDQARDRHLSWVAALAGSLRSWLATARSGDALRRYAIEVDDIRTAVAHAVAAGRTEAACQIIADVGFLIEQRPTFEALDWFDPTASTPPWSDHAIRALGHLAFAGYMHGDTAAPRRALDAVPAEHHRHPLMVLCAWFEQLWVRGDVDAAGALTADVDAGDPYDQSLVAAMRNWVDIVRVMSGTTDREFTELVQRRSAALVDDARRAGDVLTLGNALGAYGYSLVDGGRAGEAIVAATEEIRIGEMCGSGWMLDHASTVLARALVQAAAGGLDDRVVAVREIRRTIVESRDRGTLSTVVGSLDAVAALLWDHDPRTAYLLSAGYHRVWAAGRLLPDGAAVALGPDVVAELEERANAMSAPELVAVALDAIDRFLAATEADGAGP